MHYERGFKLILMELLERTSWTISTDDSRKDSSPKSNTNHKSSFKENEDEKLPAITKYITLPAPCISKLY